MANHLEQFIGEWLEYNKFVVRKNVKVGPRPGKGGYEGEIDIAAYHHASGILLHIESSMDAASFANRHRRFQYKFEIGRKYMFSEVFPWLNPRPSLIQWAVVWASDANHQELGGGTLVPVWDLYAMIAQQIGKLQKVEGTAISENFPLLRTLHHTYFWVCQRPKSMKTPDEAYGRFASILDRVNPPGM